MCHHVSSIQHLKGNPHDSLMIPKPKTNFKSSDGVNLTRLSADSIVYIIIDPPSSPIHHLDCIHFNSGGVCCWHKTLSASASNSNLFFLLLPSVKCPQKIIVWVSKLSRKRKHASVALEKLKIEKYLHLFFPAGNNEDENVILVEVRSQFPIQNTLLDTEKLSGFVHFLLWAYTHPFNTSSHTYTFHRLSLQPPGNKLMFSSLTC